MADEAWDRRDLLKLAASAAALGLGPGCASPQRTPPAIPSDLAARLDPAAADALLARIDKRLEWIDSASLPEDVLPLSSKPHGDSFDRELAPTASLIRKSIRTLYVTGRFLDLPDEMKVHPGMQARVRRMQAEMDDAVLGMTGRLERMSAEDHTRLQAFLKGNALFGERLARMLEKPAVDDGLSFQRTFGVRATTLQLTQRMAAQSPALITDPIVRKVRRIEAHPRSDAEQARRFAARVGEQAFWEHQERIVKLHEAWMIRLGNDGVIASTTFGANSSDPPLTPGQSTLRTGGITMGFGLGSVVLGLIFAGLASATSAEALIYPALFFGVTLGPILLVIGLIIVIVGALMRLGE